MIRFEKIFSCAFYHSVFGLPLFSFLLFVSTAHCPVTAMDNRHFDLLDIRPHRLAEIASPLGACHPCKWGQSACPITGCHPPIAHARPGSGHHQMEGLTSTFQRQPRWPEESLQISRRPPIRPQGSDLRDQPPRKGCSRRRVSSVECWDRRRHASHDTFTCGQT